MLDEIKYITRFDSSDTLQLVSSSPELLAGTPGVARLDLSRKYTRLIFVSDGELANVARSLGSYLRASLDCMYEITNASTSLRHINENCLLLTDESSGQLYELCDQAAGRGAQVLRLIGDKSDYGVKTSAEQIYLESSKSIKNQEVFWWQVSVVFQVLERARLLDNVSSELKSVQSLLHISAKQWGVDRPTKTNLAKQLATELLGKASWIYASQIISSSGYHWKRRINERALTLATARSLPLGGSEISSWRGQPVEKPFAVVQLLSHLEMNAINQQIDLDNRQLSGWMPNPNIIQARGNSQLEQLLWSLFLVEFVSIYLGVLGGVNQAKL